jgi:uncharacterized protein
MMSDAPTDRHGLEVLSMSQCLALLRSRPLGRIAYLEAGGPTVVPINHLVDGSNLVLRSLGGGKLDAAILNAPRRLPAGRARPGARHRLERAGPGRAVLVDDPEEMARYAAELDSWAISEPGEATWIRIIAEEISGRRLRRDE